MEPFLPPFTSGPTTHQPKRDLQANGPPSLLGITSSVSNAFVQFAPMINPISMLDALGTLFAIFFR